MFEGDEFDALGFATSPEANAVADSARKYADWFLGEIAVPDALQYSLKSARDSQILECRGTSCSEWQTSHGISTDVHARLSFPDARLGSSQQTFSAEVSGQSCEETEAIGVAQREPHLQHGR